jgi:Tol biopolymer transport system component
VAALFAGLAFVAGRVLLQRPAIDPPRLRTLTYSGHDSSPAVSPDGRLVAFSSDREGRRRIWLKQLSGAAEVPLTPGPDDFPRFSPDGASLLFTGSEGGRTGLYRVPTLGGAPRKLLEDVLDGDWSPDGKQVAFSRWIRKGAVVDTLVGVLPAEGGEPRTLALLAGHTLFHPRFSPDGRTVALVDSGESPRLWIFLVDTADGSVREVEPIYSGGHISSVVWSADGKALLYAQTESLAVGFSGSPARVVRQDVRSRAGRTQLWLPSHSDVIDALGPDRLVFEFRSLRQNLLEVPLAAGGPPSRWVTRGNSTVRQPVYAPDGDWVAFTSNRDGNLDLWKLSTRTGAIARVTEHPAEDWDPAFTADGRRMVWSSNRTGRFEIWMGDADGSNPRQVSHDGSSAQNPTATPDGAWITFTSDRPQQPGVYKIRADSSQTALVAPQSALWPELSPDGALVLYTTVESGHHTVRVARVAEGTAVPFEIRVPAGGDGRARWWPDGRAIAFTGVDESGATGVFAQDFVPGRDTSASRRRLAGFDRGYVTESFGIAPDASRITVAASEQLWSLMLAEGIGERLRSPAP